MATLAKYSPWVFIEMERFGVGALRIAFLIAFTAVSGCASNEPQFTDLEKAEAEIREQARMDRIARNQQDSRAIFAGLARTASTHCPALLLRDVPAPFTVSPASLSILNKKQRKNIRSEHSSRLTVSSVYSDQNGDPSKLRSGDIILEIDDHSFEWKSFQESGIRNANDYRKHVKKLNSKAKTKLEYAMEKQLDIVVERQGVRQVVKAPLENRCGVELVVDVEQDIMLTTLGNKVYAGSLFLSLPESAQKELLAHELAHVIAGDYKTHTNKTRGKDALGTGVEIGLSLFSYSPISDTASLLIPKSVDLEYEVFSLEQENAADESTKKILGKSFDWSIYAQAWRAARSTPDTSKYLTGHRYSSARAAKFEHESQ